MTDGENMTSIWAILHVTGACIKYIGGISTTLLGLYALQHKTVIDNPNDPEAPKRLLPAGRRYRNLVLLLAMITLSGSIAGDIADNRLKAAADSVAKLHENNYQDINRSDGEANDRIDQLLVTVVLPKDWHPKTAAGFEADDTEKRFDASIQQSQCDLSSSMESNYRNSEDCYWLIRNRKFWLDTHVFAETLYPGPAFGIFVKINLRRVQAYFQFHDCAESFKMPSPRPCVNWAGLHTPSFGETFAISTFQSDPAMGTAAAIGFDGDAKTDLSDQLDLFRSNKVLGEDVELRNVVIKVCKEQLEDDCGQSNISGQGLIAAQANALPIQLTVVLNERRFKEEETSPRYLVHKLHLSRDAGPITDIDQKTKCADVTYLIL